MHPQVSVIIPVFNASGFIIRCVNSLFAQTIDSVEFIFIDDGSTDDSIAIIKKVLVNYPNRQEQALFFSLPVHSGVGAARQQGLELAKGKYVIHCDSDDWVEPRCYQLMLEKAETTNADIVCCGFSVDTSDVKQLSVVPPLDTTLAPRFDIGPQVGSLWSKLIKRDFINTKGLKIATEIDWGEDLCFSLEALLLSRNIQQVDCVLYHYVQQPGSLTHDITFAKVRTLVHCGNIVDSFLRERGLYETYKDSLNWLKFQLKQYYLISPKTRSLKLWRLTFPECDTEILSYPAPLYLRISSWLNTHKLVPFAWILLKLKDYLSLLKNRDCYYSS